MAMSPRSAVVLGLLACLAGVVRGSAGYADPQYRKCVEECGHSGCVGNTCFQLCRIFSGVATDGPWYMQEPLYLQWKQWDCKADCRYHCMLEIENEKQKLGQRPVKYHGQWPFKRVFGSRDVNFTEKLDYSFALAVLDVSLIFSIFRAFSIRDEATRVMVSAPFIGFTATHILNLNFYKVDYGLNMKVCVLMDLAQLLIWAIWVGST